MQSEIHRPGTSLIDLPTEVILQIFDFLPPRSLFFSLRRVCKRFAELLGDDIYYKGRFKRKYLTNNPINPFLTAYGLFEDGPHDLIEEGISWCDITVRADVRESICTGEGAIEQHMVSGPHTSGLDTVRLLKGDHLCVTGGRDKLICLWDLKDSVVPVSVRHEAHAGWIWDIVTSGDSFFSCGWETTIKEWSFSRGLECVRKYSTERPAMRLASSTGLLLAGLHTGKVIIIDPRSGNTEGRSSYKCHKGAITGLKMFNNLILSVGEDRRVVAYDTRAMRNYFQGSVKYSCPRCTAVYGGLWYIGDTHGCLTAYEIANLRQPILVESISQHCAVNAIYPSMEGLITGLSDGKLRFLSLVDPLRIQKDIQFSGEITSVDCCNNVIVLSTSDSAECFRVLKINDTAMESIKEYYF